jgi:stress-induced morphogen
MITFNTTRNLIEARLRAKFPNDTVEVLRNTPPGFTKVVVVSRIFDGLSRLKRVALILRVIGNAYKGPIKFVLVSPSDILAINGFNPKP